MAVNRRFIYASLSVLASALVSQAALGQRNTVLQPEASGSRPYRETVNRFLKGQEPKVIGGKPATSGAHPWQVSLGVAWMTDPYRAHFCGGSLVSASWVVTAAHCLDGTPPKDVSVTAGTTKLGSGGHRRNVKRIVVKSDYDSNTQDNDIALIELLTPMPDIQEIRPIKLLTMADEAEALKKDTELVVLGWGATQEGGNAVRDLRLAVVPLVERASCNRPLAYDGAITENMICAGKTSGGTDSCQGDSGGSLSKLSANSNVLAGIVSWGEGCARPNKVGVYSRVAKFSSWVDSCIAAPDACK